ncbi:MAG TPA: hypothetical protein VI893_05660, partial [Thermoplasmata archaeon]|nr:hypothetical protein [Thermoplasmata archaeon]
KVTFEPQASGIWEITATSGIATGKAVITVTPGRLSEVKVDPETATLREGDSVKFTARGFDVSGNEILDAEVKWEVTDRLGTFAADGTFSASKVGDGKVIARVTKGQDTVNGQATVSVTSMPPQEALYRLVGGQTNFFFILLLLIALIAAGVIGGAVSRRRRKAQEEAVNAFYSQAAQGPPPPPTTPAPVAPYQPTDPPPPDTPPPPEY